MSTADEHPAYPQVPRANGIHSGVGNGVSSGSEVTASAEPVVGAATISVVIVDDHDGFRAGLKSLLTDYGFEVVGDAADGEEALALVESLAPDVVLMDLQLPRMSGLEATRRIVASSPTTAVLMLTVSASEGDVVEALVGGASGYLVKGTSPETVAAGISAATRGESLMSAEVAASVFARLRNDGPSPSVDDVPLSFLSAREVEILRLLASGKHNEEIAKELVISPFTVRNHVSALLRKLHLHNRTQAAAYAIRQGL